MHNEDFLYVLFEELDDLEIYFGLDWDDDDEMDETHDDWDELYWDMLGGYTQGFISPIILIL